MTSFDLTSDTASAVDFLARLLPGERWDLASIPPERGAPEFRTFLPNEHQDAAPWIEARQGKTGLYYTPNEVAANVMHKKAKKSDISAARALHVDVDIPTEAALHAIRNFAPPPTVIVLTGGGYQA